MIKYLITIMLLYFVMTFNVIADAQHAGYSNIDFDVGQTQLTSNVSDISLSGNGSIDTQNKLLDSTQGNDGFAAKNYEMPRLDYVFKRQQGTSNGAFVDMIYVFQPKLNPLISA